MPYPCVFSPGRIGLLTAKNRIKYAATESNFNTLDGFVTDREIAYLEAQAAGAPPLSRPRAPTRTHSAKARDFGGLCRLPTTGTSPGLRVSQAQ